MLGKIYYLWSPGREEIYVGSSTLSLEQILRRHRNTFKNWLNDNGPFYSSFYLFYQKLAGHDVFIDLLHEGEFENEKQMRQMERTYTEIIPSLNIKKPFITDRDKYPKRNAWLRRKVACKKCGKVYSQGMLYHHMKTHALKET